MVVKKTIKKLFTLILLLIGVLPILSVGIQAGSDKTVELYLENNSAKIEYSPDLWQLYNKPNGPVIQMKNEKKIAAIRGSRIPSTLEQDAYVADFKNYMRSNSIDGRVEESTLNHSPLLSFSMIDGKVCLTFTVLVVKDGPGYYEITFCCVKDLYAKYKNEALKVMQTFEIVHSSEDQVINDPELSKMLKSLDKSAGYDDEAVMRNLSADGAELIGVWHYKNNPEFIRTYYADGFFKEIMSEDGSDYVLGTWKYDPLKRVIYHYIGKAMVDGVEITDQMEVRTLSFAVKNFDKKTMYGITLEIMQLRTFIKE